MSMGGMLRSGGKSGPCSFSDNYYSKVHGMMLRFRPIAPKPIGGQAVPTDMLPEKTNRSNIGRKYARVGSRNKQYYCSKRKRGYNKLSPVVEPSELTNEQGSSSTDKSLPTLQLLPKPKADHHDEDEVVLKNDQVWCNVEDRRNTDLRCISQWKAKQDYDQQTNVFADYNDEEVVEQRWAPCMMIESRVTVERVTNRCMDGVGLGFSDVEKINNLLVDPNPGFVSDCSGKVEWVNEAYKKLVSQKQDHQPTELGVELVVKEELPYSYPSFARTVRIEYAWGGSKSSRVVPCDVWRMDFGGFAWKLDIKASLSLGLQPF